MIPHELIDRVARDMTEVAPARDLQADVLVRLARAPERPWKRLALPAIAAGLALAAFVMTRTAPEVTNPAQVSLEPRVSRPGSPTAPPKPARAGNHALRQITAPTMSAEELAWQQRAVPALEPAAPLEVAAIQPTAIQIAPITVEPITVDPIVMPDGSSRPIDRER